MPGGYITGFVELIDVAGNFNPSTGVFTIGNKVEEQGTYLFLFGGLNLGGPSLGKISVLKNGVIVQYIQDNERDNSYQLNGMATLNLVTGDQVKLSNSLYSDLIDVSYNYPFLFTGYKI